MKCSPLLKAAFNSIELEYKLDSIIADLPKTTEFNSETMNRYLIKKGVSPKEIKASGILNMYKGDYKFPASEWQDDFKKLGDKHHINTIDVTNTGIEEGYDDVTLDKKGLDNPTYRETMYQSKKIPKAPDDVRHYPEYNKGNKSILGWNRTHVDNINGKDTTVLNEFQSDWAQTERSGKGVFRNSLKDTSETIDTWRQGRNVEVNPDTGEIISIDGVTNDQYNKARELESRKIVADFPMSEKAHTQLQIVDAINQAIKNGTNRIAIPIKRENELVGTKGVTKFYDSLNKKILPDIKRKLEKQGLKLKVSKEGYIPSKNTDPYIDMSTEDTDAIYAKLEEDGIDTKELDEFIRDKTLKNFNEVEALKELDSWITSKYGEKYTMKSIYSDTGVMYDSHNILHVIEVEEIPGHKVTWNVYQLLGAIGLGDLADKLREKDKKQ